MVTFWPREKVVEYGAFSITMENQATQGSTCVYVLEMKNCEVVYEGAWSRESGQ